MVILSLENARQYWLLNKLSRFSLLFIFLGTLSVSFAVGWRHYQARVLSFTREYPTLETSIEKSFSKESGVKSVKIEKLGLKLPVKSAGIHNGVWEIWPDEVSHLDKSLNPGQGGNIVVYGHNTNSIFGPIRWLKEGDLVELDNNEGKRFLYKVSEVTIVSPEAIDYVLPKDEETLTLYTCTGLIDSRRHIVIAKPVAE